MSRAQLPRRSLGSSGLVVSALGLGSWRTYERIPREQGLAVMRAAREHGIDFLDDARYDDSTGKAPLATGYSEVVFGELFRAAAWQRDRVVVANKLWWEFWPEQSAAQELDASLGRLGFDYLDLVYSAPPPAVLEVPEVFASIGALIASGKVRAWGVLNWPAAKLHEAAAVALREGVPQPCAAQLPYNVVARSPVEDADMVAALEASGAVVVASSVLAAGALTGKYLEPGASGRIAAELDQPRRQGALAAAALLRLLADEWDTTPSVLAVAFALANPRVGSALFGATAPEQVAENVGAVELVAARRNGDLAELLGIGRV
jgi:aryl-alcohol dehydrogenase-like predicted oxidoreductase